MTVISAIPDTESLTLTVVAQLAAPPARVWQLWVDPRQLERWWGPPTWPATFTAHDPRPGGRSSYRMTGPDGTTANGWWRFHAIDELRSLEIDEGFADADGEPDLTMPTTRMRLDLSETADGTRMTLVSHFASVEQMQQLLEMGMVDGMSEAMSQIDAILGEG
ncbi:MAG: SRPBCC domain-containing protein [Actinobacteria bacterium]|nr:SRPBCC domain-containing protein [Actinomycetota bacterium]